MYNKNKITSRNETTQRGEQLDLQLHFLCFLCFYI